MANPSITKGKNMINQLRINTTSFILLAFCMMSLSSLAQEPRTIRVKKQSDLSKAVFDNVEAQLIVVDRFGNPRDNKIASYKLFVKDQRDTKEFLGYSNKLTPDMMNYLEKQSDAVKLFFTEIAVKDDDEHLEKLPDVIEVWFPACMNKKGKKHR